jgi:hypothetical protein
VFTQAGTVQAAIVKAQKSKVAINRFRAFMFSSQQIFKSPKLAVSKFVQRAIGLPARQRDLQLLPGAISQ